MFNDGIVGYKVGAGQLQFSDNWRDYGCSEFHFGGI